MNINKYYLLNVNFWVMKLIFLIGRLVIIYIYIFQLDFVVRDELLMLLKNNFCEDSLNGIN